MGSGKLDQMIPKVSFKVELLKGEIEDGKWRSELTKERWGSWGKRVVE